MELNEIKHARLLQENKTVYLKSKFKFLMAHNGIRPGKMHLLLSTSGAGKSSLIRALMREVSASSKIGIWLSEETAEEFESYLAQAAMPERCIKNMTVFSEREVEHSEKSAKEMFEQFEIFSAGKFDVLFFDNLTTSLFYNNQKNAVQSGVARKIKAITAKMGYATFLVAHTDSSINEYNQQLISDTNIRGDKTILNEIQFLYAFQRFSIGQDSFPFVRILKARDPSATSTLFGLEYSVAGKIYTSDEMLSFDDLKSAYNSRNKLGAK